MRHQAALTMSAMLAITFVVSYVSELFGPERPVMAGSKPHIAILAGAGHEMNDRAWLDLAARTSDALASSEVDGVVIMDGSDAIEETAYFLNLVVRSDKPVVLADANVEDAVATAADVEARGRGVVVLMNDEIHVARSVRALAGQLRRGRIVWFPAPGRQRAASSEFTVNGLTSLPRVDIIYAHANMSMDLIAAAIRHGAQGLVIAGVGDGSLSQAVLDTLARASRHGVLVVRSSREERGMVLRNDEVNDDRLRFVASGEIDAPRSRVLLQLALLQTRDPVRIQKMFDDY